MDQKHSRKPLLAQLDLFDTVFAFLCITALCIWFVVSPERSSQVLSSIRSFLGDEMGSYYRSRYFSVLPVPGIFPFWTDPTRQPRKTAVLRLSVGRDDVHGRTRSRHSVLLLL